MKPSFSLLIVLALASSAIGQACPPGSKTCPYSSSSPSRARRPPEAPYLFDRASGNVAPWRTAVRITASTDAGAYVGSGTIVDGSPDSALAITAAHVVRKPDGTTFLVEIFGQGDPNGKTASIGPPIGSFAGEVVDSDAGLDVGLIRFRPGRQLPSSRLVPEGWAPISGQPLCSVGCSSGDDPTAISERFLRRQTLKMKGFPYPSIECDREPPQGRSGGGLFEPNGRLIGVCDFAETQSHTGLYADVESIRTVLRRNSFLAIASGSLASTPKPPPPPDAQKNAPPVLDYEPPHPPGIEPGAPTNAGPLPGILAAIAATLGIGGPVGGLAIWGALKKARAINPLALAQGLKAKPTLEQLVPQIGEAIEALEADALAVAQQAAEAKRNAEIAAQMVALFKSMKSPAEAPPKP